MASGSAAGSASGSAAGAAGDTTAAPGGLVAGAAAPASTVRGAAWALIANRTAAMPVPVSRVSNGVVRFMSSSLHRVVRSRGAGRSMSGREPAIAGGRVPGPSPTVIVPGGR
ncbi:hypothetical protein B5D80_22540 [Micromonospora wenchangensis]|uniref:Uncharacterized protein n=1 Tax=Micromonospora wenchangensis TaxID=1185415 RepID=A0A246RHI5_9ACTN|nr:hypothetical protein B5D80_22540 [Micromonospora wenchangensis]